ncbi:MAG: hypothetical protein OXE86_05930 [Alphaproteobacteria bacterium]|nr:hypothetical protein [Alphaproteobacteria bacterium]
MPRSDRKRSGTGSKPNRKRCDARKPRSIRFADSEWKLVERAAARHGIPAGEVVRAGALALAEDRLGEPPPATLSKGHAALVEATYRLVYVMATLRREDLLDAGRENELCDLIAEARRTMTETMEESAS